jgi:hypothetical protein
MKLRLRYIPIFATLALLVGIVVEGMARPRPMDAEPFHRRVFEASKGIQSTIGDWDSSEVEVPPAAVALLRPNVIRQRRYVNRRTGRRADLLVVQCEDARDMAGHYPPICYPSHGWNAAGTEAAEWKVEQRVISGMEYYFTRLHDGREVGCYVRNLIVLPTGTLVRDMDQVRAAASDFLRQFYGAAQIQVVMDADVPSAERDEIFAELVGPHLSLLDVLMSGGTS